MSYGIEIRKPNSTNIILPEYPGLQINTEKVITNNGSNNGPTYAPYYYLFKSVFTEQELENYTNIFVKMEVGDIITSIPANNSFTDFVFYSNKPQLNVKMSKPADLLTSNNYDLEVYNSSGQKVYIASKKLMTITDTLTMPFINIRSQAGYTKSTNADWISILNKPWGFSYDGFTVGFIIAVIIDRPNSTSYRFRLGSLALGPPVNYYPSNSHQLRYFFSDSTI